MPRHRKLLIGLVLGSALGLAAHALAGGSPALLGIIRFATEPLGKIFVRLLLLLSVPIVFSALVIGVCELDFRQLGRIGARTLAYAAVVSTIAAAIALILVNLLQPGVGAQALLRGQAPDGLPGMAKAPVAAATPSAVDALVSIVPTNPIQAAASGDIVGFIFFALLFGIGLALVKTPATATLKTALQGVLDVSMRLVDAVLSLAPYGIAALLFTTTARVGWEVISQLAAYVAIVVLGLALQLFVVYGISVRWLGGRSPRAFFRDIRVALLTAFSTASSNATLPTALRVADENLHLPPHVSRFVLTAGSTMNQNGTALFEGVTILFLAQVYGVEMGVAKQASVLGISILAGIGTAGVPAGSLPVMAAILTTLGIPAEGIGIILGVDRFLDMCRTTVNVAGDLAAAVFVARRETDSPPAAMVPTGTEPGLS
jgi:DAACS family dicarboxylate/amino acid:cation (Na+ or H+) symporter